MDMLVIKASPGTFLGQFFFILALM